MPPASLGQRIKQKRLSLGMTQRELAESVGISVPYASKIEADKETPTDEKIRKVAKVLQLDADELILTAGRVPSDVMHLLAADPVKGLEFLRKVRK